ncbi:MAG: rhodanese-like domain-containing protein [Prolixibacteraceae bacterium]|nr:rhodanese-like domain-containing protein [Burkholderiales bacterium]
MSRTISREELRINMSSITRPVLVEALPEKYYVAQHLPGALHLPHDQVDAIAAIVLPEKAAQIVVYCANRQCQNSHIAAHRLSALGYTDVSVYAAGKQDWEEAGLPFESGFPETAVAA